MELSVIGALLTALLYSGLAVALASSPEWRLPTQHGARPLRLLMLAIVASAAWGWSAVLQDGFAGMPSRVVDAADLLRYGAWFAFLAMTLRTSAGLPVTAGVRWLRWLALLAPAIAAIALIAAPEPSSGGAARVVLVGGLALPLLGLILVEQLYRNAVEDARWSVKPLCLALALLFGTDFYLYAQGVLFGALDRDAVAVRGAIHALTAPLLYLSMRRHRGVGIGRLRVSRSAAFHSAALMLTGAYLLLAAAAGWYVRDFGGSWGAVLQQVLFGVALAVLAALAVSGAVRSRLKLWIGRNFFRYRYDYREEWLRFTERLSVRGSPGEMSALVVRALADMVESPGGALWTLRGSEATFAQAARLNAPDASETEPAGSAFCAWLKQQPVVDLPAARRNVLHRDDAASFPPLPRWLSDPGPWWLVVPLVVADELIGFVVLCPARVPVPINWEVSELLGTAGRQAASYLLQMRLTEELLETRKFESFNRMSAFVVHDLKNIVTQLGLMMKNATRHRDNPEFQKDMLATVENSLEKMRRMMLQLREGDAGPGGAAGVDLPMIAQRVGAIAAARGRRVDLRIEEPVLTRGHGERIERVIGHVVQNALDATPVSGRVWIALGRRGDEAWVEVGDTGSGMSAEYVRSRLFKPFESTKAAGMGIGAYESFLYVRELGGGIAVDSEPGRGTVMRITLPLLHSPSDARLQPSSAS